MSPFRKRKRDADDEHELLLFRRVRIRAIPTPTALQEEYLDELGRQAEMLFRNYRKNTMTPGATCAHELEYFMWQKIKLIPEWSRLESVSVVGVVMALNMNDGSN